MPNRSLAKVAACAVMLALLGCGAQANPQGTATLVVANTSASGMMVAEPAPLPPNAELNGRAWGLADAPIRVLKFIDYQCPTCAQYTRDEDPGIVEAFAATGQVRFEYRILTFIGRESYDAGMASLCAADQGAFWTMHRSLFLNQPFDGRENTGKFTREHLRDLAVQLGLDLQAFDRCMDADQHKATLDQDAAEARQYDVGRTPELVINGQAYPSARSADDLRKIFAEIAPGVALDH
ncbi:MAG: DsbA family protein [Chloroflexi bacterium]|nr:DsbA family protein [Chloroflexota bacterium]